MWSQKILIKEKWKPRRIDCCRDVVDVYRGAKTFGIPEIALVSTIFIKIMQAEIKKKMHK